MLKFTSDKIPNKWKVFKLKLILLVCQLTHRIMNNSYGVVNVLRSRKYELIAFGDQKQNHAKLYSFSMWWWIYKSILSPVSLKWEKWQADETEHNIDSLKREKWWRRYRQLKTPKTSTSKTPQRRDDLSSLSLEVILLRKKWEEEKKTKQRWKKERKIVAPYNR